MTHHAQVYKLLNDHFGDKPFTFVEIGTFRADLAKGVLSMFPNCTRLWTIDPWRHVDGVEFEASCPQSMHDTNKAHSYQCLKEFKERAVILNMTSDEAVNQLKGNSYDVIWVDGHHDSEAITKDINNYYPLAKSGGIFGGHDYGQVFPLTNIVKDFLDNKNYIINTGSDFTFWIFKK